jgi:amino-acid N-acetyltransferase
MGEMACLTVNPDAQSQGDGERILKHIEKRTPRWLSFTVCADNPY